MRDSGGPVIKDIVLVGGGHAHVIVIKRFAMRAVRGLRLTLISPDAQTPYSGMLPGLIAGHYTHDETHIDLRPLCRFAGVAFVRSTVQAIDLDGKKVHLPGRPPIPYDILSINAGSTPDPKMVPGAAGVVIPVKPVSQFLVEWQALKADVVERPDMRIGVVGGGAGGVELVLSAQHAINSELAAHGIGQRPVFTLVTAGADILETHGPNVRKAFRRILAERKIEPALSFAVDKVEPDGVVSAGRRIALDRILWVTGAQPPQWIAQSGLETDERGFMAVDQTLQSTSHPDVFGAGDNATIVGLPRPKSGVFAVRQGPALADNLRKAALAKPLRRYRPQRDFLTLISTGDKYAVGSRGRWSAEGAWVWRVKDWIDRQFMSKFNELPEMDQSRGPLQSVPLTSEIKSDLGELDMRCGGCGAKVGASALSNALGPLAIEHHSGVLVGLNAPDDAAVISVPPGRAIVQSVDMFRSMIDDPYTFGMVAANHALGDLFAMGAAPYTALAVVIVPPGQTKKTEATLLQVMSGAVSVLNAVGCELVGGHTAEGAELALGFSVTGLIDPDAVLQKSGLRPGDALVLTKPIGTGVILAADMRAKAKGRWIEAALETALQSNAEAAQILRNSGATAMTDVTGFGLGGHLAELLDASGVGARIALEAIPAIEGSLEALASGIASSLHAKNSQRRNRMQARPELERSARYDLLFDPQTAGGLLAGVPSDLAADCVERLRAAGYRNATIIGEVVDHQDDTTDIEVIDKIDARRWHQLVPLS